MKHNNLYKCNCGGVAKAYEDYSGWWRVQCNKCGLNTMVYREQEFAEKVWNEVMKCNEGADK